MCPFSNNCLQVEKSLSNAQTLSKNQTEKNSLQMVSQQYLSFSTLATYATALL